ncbi:MAG: hypothetical protein AABY32_06490 [Nanoarchaeota archaeon]
MTIDQFKDLVGTFIPNKLYLVSCDISLEDSLTSTLNYCVRGHIPYATWKYNDSTMTITETTCSNFTINVEAFVEYYSSQQDSPFLMSFLSFIPPTGNPSDEGRTSHVQFLQWSPWRCYYILNRGGSWYYDGEFTTIN